jgi:enoyl-CoA hydratase/carnithine racemase
MTSYQQWSMSIEDRVATVTLERAANMNTLTPEALYELRQLAHDLDQNPDVWAVILQGAGEHFSAGVDVSVIGQIVGQSEAQFGAALRDLQACLDAWEALAKPTIAKIKGYCVGGGVILSLCCDFRLAEANAKIIVPEVKRGIAVIMGTKRLTRTIGLARTKELTMLGDSISAQEAHSIGLLHRVYPNERFEAEVAAFADRFRRLPPLTVALCKRIAEESQHLTLAENQAQEIALQAQLLHTEDIQEAIASFLEKRPPTFKGR